MTICVFRRGKNERFLTVLPTFELAGGNYITLSASILDTFSNTLSSVKCSCVCFGICNMCQTDESCTFQMVARRVNMRYSTMETVELVLNEGSDLEDFSDSGSEENIVDSSEESRPVDLEANLRVSNNNFIFIIGIRATSRIKLLFLLCLDSSRFAVGTEKGTDMTLWTINLTSTHSKLSKNVYMFIVLFLVVYLQKKKNWNGQKQCIYRSQVRHFVASWMS